MTTATAGAWGLWSDGEHMWVCDYRYAQKVRAHPMPEAYGQRIWTRWRCRG